MTAPLGQTYYPACLVNMLIRFDEAFNADAEIESGILGNVLVDATVPEIRARLLALRAASSTKNSGGLAQLPTGRTLFDAQANQKGSSILARIPLRASIELNNIRKPSTFNMTFDYKDLPIDPRLVRSVGIEIFLDTVSATDFAQGINQAPGNPRTSQNIIGASGRFRPTPKNLVLKGIVDNWQVSHGSSGSTATLEGRDLVGLMLNTPITVQLLQKMGNMLDRPIDQVIKTIVASVGAWNDLIEVDAPQAGWPVDGNGTFGPPPIVQKSAKLSQLSLLEVKEEKTNPRGRSSADGKKPRVSLGADQNNLSVWDLITRYCNLVSAVPYFTIKEVNGQFKSVLWIQPQLGLYDFYADSKGKFRAETPFNTTRTVEIAGGATKEFRVRKLMYGRNIEDLSYERKYQGITARAVEVVSYDTSSTRRGGDRVISAISKLRPSYAQKIGATPPLAKKDAQVKSGAVPSGLSEQDEVLRVYVKGVTDINQLQIMADGLFEEIMRGETGGSVRTRSLASFGAGNEDPDLLHIRPRDPLELSVDIRPGNAQLPASTTVLIEQTRKSVMELETEIFARTKDRNLARAIAYSSKNAVAQLQNAFRVNSVAFDWDVNSGIGVSIDFHNYIMARNAVTSSPVSQAPASPPGRANAAKSNQSATSGRARSRGR